MTVPKTRILIVDDEPSAVEILEMHLAERDFDVRSAVDAKGLSERLDSFKPEIVVLDVRLPDADGLDLLKALREGEDPPYVIVVTAFHDMATTIKAIKHGAFEYVTKPIDLDDLDAAIERAVVLSRSPESAEDLSVNEHHDVEPLDIIGKTKKMKEIFKTIGILSSNRVTVLIEGETGTGKELVARAIHYHSPGRDEPFIAINCSAIVENLLESEFFGHEKGAFTGAASAKKGRFELAGSGSILLDEICEMPLALQAKLLRFLQDREFTRVGGERTISSNARVIASTNRKTLAMVKAGEFREDLYYRLSVTTIRIPPLRERPADIPLLVEHLLKKINRNLNTGVNLVEARALSRMEDYDWPGNVRQLENLLTCAVMHTQGNTLRDEFVSGLLDGMRARTADEHDVSYGESQHGDPYVDEKERIENALHAAKWHYGKASEILGVSYPTLKKRIKKYDIPIKPRKQSR
ncbi:MAG: sigma-54 dependent transcriptional regulator [Pseudomonadota bacterium]